MQSSARSTVCQVTLLAQPLVCCPRTVLAPVPGVGDTLLSGWRKRRVECRCSTPTPPWPGQAAQWTASQWPLPSRPCPVAPNNPQAGLLLNCPGSFFMWYLRCSWPFRLLLTSTFSSLPPPLRARLPPNNTHDSHILIKGHSSTSR